MDTRLQYFGRYRLAEHCGSIRIHGFLREVYFIDIDRDAIVHARAIVRCTPGTDIAKLIFLGAMESDLGPISSVEWSDSDAAARARAWVAEECSERAAKLAKLAKLVALADSLRATTEISPS